MKVLTLTALLLTGNAFGGELYTLPEFDITLSCKTKDINTMILILKKEAGGKAFATGNHLDGKITTITPIYETDSVFISTNKNENEAGLDYATLLVRRTVDGLVAEGELFYELKFCPPNSFCYDYDRVAIECHELK